MKKKIDRGYLLSLAAAVASALLVGALIMLITGHDPVAAYRELVRGATGCSKWSDVVHIFSKRQFGNTIEYAMVLFLTGLACAIGARVGIFNVGGEGQLYLGAIVSAYIGAQMAGRAPWLVVSIAALGAMAVGGFYAWIPGVLKVKLKVNEVITTIMMNTIAIYLCSYLSNGPWKTSHPNRVSGTETLAEHVRFTRLIPGSNLTGAIVTSIVIAFLIWYVMAKTTKGYEMKLIGENPRFAKFAGLKVDSTIINTMVISGAICGLVGMFEVYGVKGNYQDGISNEYYFDGLLVAMIMRYKPVGIIFMSFAFAFLKVGAQGMELNAGVPGELYRIIQAVVIFFLAAQSGVKAILDSRKKGGAANG